MLWLCAALSAAGVLKPIICSCLVAEMAGCWLRWLFHCDKLPFLSRSYTVHPIFELLRSATAFPKRKDLAIAPPRYRLAGPALLRRSR
jgi:hypothetical protein